MEKFTLHTQFTSLQEMAYSQAKVSGVLHSMAVYAKANIAGFPDEVSDEGKAELYAGYRKRYAENQGITKYAVIDGNYIPVNDKTTKQLEGKKVEYAEIGVAYVFSFSQQEYGQLKNKNPQLYALIKPIREATNTYCSNRLAELKNYAKEGKAKGTRVQAKDFNAWLSDTFDTIKARAKTAKARGESINEKKLSEAIVAFNVAFKHGE